jgi:DNA polymerase-3 subunit beta
VSLEGATLRMVATDSYRLSVKESAVPSANGSAFEANVPARALQELGRVIAETHPETVAIVTKDNQVVCG